MIKKKNEEGLWNGGNILFLNLGVGYKDVFILRSFNELHTFMICTLTNICILFKEDIKNILMNHIRMVAYKGARNVKMGIKENK